MIIGGVGMVLGSIEVVTGVYNLYTTQYQHLTTQYHLILPSITNKLMQLFKKSLKWYITIKGHKKFPHGRFQRILDTLFDINFC